MTLLDTYITSHEKTHLQLVNELDNDLIELPKVDSQY